MADEGRGSVQTLLALARRRPGPLGAVLLVPTWIALGLLLVGYVVGILALAFAAVVVHTARLLLAPLQASRTRPGGTAGA